MKKEAMMEKYEDYRVQMTKQSIYEAFIGLLNQKSIQNITVKELCMKAHMNRGTFYLHYHDLYDLLDQIQEEFMKGFQEVLSHISHQTDDLFLIVVDILKYFQKHHEFCIVMLGPYGDIQFIDRFIELGKAQFQEKYKGKYSDDILSYQYTYISLGFIGILKQWLLEKPQKNVEEIAFIVCEFIDL